MKLLILPTLLAIASTVSAGCYGSGESWGNELHLTNVAIDRVCNGGGIAGGFGQSQTKYHCEQVVGNKKAEFWVQWRGGGGASLSDEECRYRLKNEAGGCQHGGESQIGSWYYRADPNSGWC